ncbi:MAG: hypothetical protein AAFU79_11075, partial [Myxococcota bacterium]
MTHVQGAEAQAPELDATGLGSTVPSPFPMYRNVGAELSVDASGVHTLDGWGHRPDDGWDMMGFAYAPVDGDFKLSIRLLEVPNCSYLNVGLMAREGLIGHEPKVYLGYNRNADGWRLIQRFSPGDDTGTNCPGGYRKCQTRRNLERFSNPSEVFLQLERRGPAVQASWSQDGIAWVALADPYDLAAPDAFVGVAMSCGNKGAARGLVRFDRVRLESAEAPISMPPDAGLGDVRSPDLGADPIDQGSMAVDVSPDAGGSGPDAAGPRDAAAGDPDAG